MTELARRLARDERIPTLPMVVSHLLAVYASEDYSLADVVDVVEHDPAISTRLLRLANSVFYGMEREISTVGGAVMMLGNATVQGLALGTALLKPWEVNLAPEAVRNIWMHSYLCAVGCRDLGERAANGSMHGEADLFAGGLLHDIGKILLLKRDPATYAALVEKCPTDEELEIAERQAFGETHRELGIEALTGWNLPPSVAGFAFARTVGDMRAEYRFEASVFTAVHEMLTGREATGGEYLFGADLLERAKAAIESRRPQAEAFFQCMAGN